MYLERICFPHINKVPARIKVQKTTVIIESHEGITPLENKQTLSEKEYRAYYEKYGTGFRVGMGAEAIKELLKNVDLKISNQNS